MKTTFGYLLAIVAACFCVALGSIAGFCLIASLGTVSNPSFMFISSLIVSMFTWLGLRLLRFIIHVFKLKLVTPDQTA